MQASNKPTADDKKGGFHAEGGIAWTKGGKQTVAPAKPGPYKDVTTPGAAHIDTFNTADPSKAKPGDVQADAHWHVHPSGEITETQGATARRRDELPLGEP